MTTMTKTARTDRQAAAGFPPRLFIIGAQKAGTTSLAAILGRHPDIALGRSKEPDFYARYWDRGFDWYRENYPDAARWLLDASPSYSAGFLAPDGAEIPVAARIAAHVEDPRFIYLVRDPVRRAWSSYWHAARFEGEAQPPEEALRPGSSYVRTGCYADRLAPFLDRFPRAHLLVLQFESFVRDQQAAVDTITDFLGLARMRLEDKTTSKNRGFRYSPLAQLVRRFFPSDRAFARFVAAAKTMTPTALRPLAARAVARDIPPMPETLREELAAFYAPHNARLEALLGRQFSDWIRPE